MFRINKYSSVKGVSYLSGEFVPVYEYHCHHIKPINKGGKHDFDNLNTRYLLSRWQNEHKKFIITHRKHLGCNVYSAVTWIDNIKLQAQRIPANQEILRYNGGIQLFRSSHIGIYWVATRSFKQRRHFRKALPQIKQGGELTLWVQQNRETCLENDHKGKASEQPVFRANLHFVSIFFKRLYCRRNHKRHQVCHNQLFVLSWRYRAQGFQRDIANGYTVLPD